MSRSLISKALLATLYAAFALLFLMVATMPFMLNTYTAILYDAFILEPNYHTFILLFLMIVGALGLWVLGEMIGMVRTISANPFVPRNVAALRRVGLIATAAAALFFGKCCLYFTILTFVCGALLALGALCALALADLFRRAVQYKEENDLTI